MERTLHRERRQELSALSVPPPRNNSFNKQTTSQTLYREGERTIWRMLRKAELTQVCSDTEGAASPEVLDEEGQGEMKEMGK